MAIAGIKRKEIFYLCHCNANWNSPLHIFVVIILIFRTGCNACTLVNGYYSMHEQLHFCGGFHSISGVQILQRGEQRAIKVTKKKKKKEIHKAELRRMEQTVNHLEDKLKKIDRKERDKEERKYQKQNLICSYHLRPLLKCNT